MQRVTLVIRGRVQGVGFRAFVLRRAADHVVAGTVRNRADGAVEVEAEGGPAALAAFAAEVRRGPMHARVEDVAEDWGEGVARFARFEVIG